MTTDAESVPDDRRPEERRARTQLTVEGIRPADVTAELLCDLMDAAKARGFALEAVSVDREKK